MSLEQVPEITIGPSTPEDYEACLRIQQAAALERYPNSEIGITREDIEADYAPYVQSEAITTETNRIAATEPDINHAQLVAKENGQVVGFCDIKVEAEYNQLLSFYVDPLQQSRGIGKALWAEAQKKLVSKNPTIVYVLPYNEQAIAFYESLDFMMTDSVSDKTGSLMASGAVMPKPVLMIRQ
ncbi:MAG: hypothetical protein RLZZ360_783 [Candidatus Parcubacteria bacterium]